MQSARVVNGSIDKLDAQVEVFRKAAAEGKISDATDPAIRDFMADLQDKNLDPEKFQIVPDEQTGALRYVGTTTNGFPVDFSLDDIANGENGFNAVAKPDMAKTIQNLMKDVTNIKKETKTNWGVAEVTDWDAMGQALDGRLDEMLSDDNMFKSIAAEEGFGFEAFQSVANGEPFVSTMTTDDGKEVEFTYESLEDIKEEVKKDIMRKVESITPHEEKPIIDNRQTLEDKAKEEAIAGVTTAFSTAVQAKDPAAFNAFLNKPIVLQGAKANIHSFEMKGNKITVIGRSGKDKITKEFDLSNANDLYLFQSTITGQDYNLIKKSAIDSLKI